MNDTPLFADKDEAAVYGKDVAKSPWRDIETAPRAELYETPIKIDILAKTWLRENDTFVFARFADCYWQERDSVISRTGSWHGVDFGYLAVAWMPIPEIPKQWP